MTDFNAIRSSASVQAAYNRASANKPDPAQSNEATDSAKSTSFSELVAKNASQAVETVRTGDATALAGLSGQAGIQQVVEATMAMESTVQVSVALRDKLVEAYQEVIRMPI